MGRCGSRMHDVQPRGSQGFTPLPVITVDSIPLVLDLSELGVYVHIILLSIIQSFSVHEVHAPYYAPLKIKCGGDDTPSGLFSRPPTKCRTTARDQRCEKGTEGENTG